MFRVLLISTLVALGATETILKINPSLTSSLASRGQENIIIRFVAGTQGVLNSISNTKFNDRRSRLLALSNALKSNAAQSQESTLKILSSEFKNFQTQSFWISNEIYVRGATNQLVKRLSELPEISEIRLENVMELSHSKIGHVRTLKFVNPSSLEPNLIQIEAHRVWEELGISGEDVIVGSIDTGVRYSHVSLRGNYLGDYGWFDPIGGSQMPTDLVGQGTHSMGVMVGKYGIGVAPEAKWSSCLGCDFSCTEASLTACAQFFLCPTLANGSNPDCSKAAHVVNNAWFTGGGNSFFNPSIAAWKIGGIIPVFGAGNAGPSCGSIRSPADSSEGVVAVASTTRDDAISARSSQGPSFYGEIKPDIVAPGEIILSASYLDDNEFMELSGGGSGSAHISGTIALMKSGIGDASWSYHNVTEWLYSNAHTGVGSAGQNCGDVTEDEFPNNSVGWGRVNAFKAVNASQMALGTNFV